MSTAPSYQQLLRAVILDGIPAANDIERLGVDEGRWLTYRRLVRNRVYETIDHCFEGLAQRLGRVPYRALVDRFLAVAGSRSPYLRDVPGEFLAWMERRADPQMVALPADAMDLARFEWAWLATTYSEDDSPPCDVTDLAMDLPPVVSAAHRLLSLTYPVHRYQEMAWLCAPDPDPVVLCLLRNPSSFEVEILELTPVMGSLLREMACGMRPLAEVVRSIAADHGAIVDGTFLRALSGALAELILRGVLLGSRKPATQPAATGCGVTHPLLDPAELSPRHDRTHEETETP